MGKIEGGELEWGGLREGNWRGRIEGGELEWGGLREGNWSGDD